jgi:3-oxoacyl-[acyl-carrier-protein] synthase-3
MPVAYSNVYLQSAGMFLPGAPVDNAGMDAFVAPLNRISERIKRRILAENGIQTRTTPLMAKARPCSATPDGAGRHRGDPGPGWQKARRCRLSVQRLLGGDALMPGFASMIQGEMAAPPMETLSVHGVRRQCGRLQAAAMAVEGGAHALALSVASEMPSRLFKRSRFAAQGYDTDFDAHFLRWMLSDGAGAVLLGGPKALPGTAPQARWTHQRSFAGDYPVCMQLGMTADRGKSHLDFPPGAMPRPQALWHCARTFACCRICSMSAFTNMQPWPTRAGCPSAASTTFSATTRRSASSPWSTSCWEGPAQHSTRALVEQSGLARQHGCSLHLHHAVGVSAKAGQRLKAGDTVLCFIPESGRFTAGYMLWEVERMRGAGRTPGFPAAQGRSRWSADSADDALPDVSTIAAPHDPATAPSRWRRC